MKTTTRKEADARRERSQAGPFVIRSMRVTSKEWTYKTRGDTWTQNLDLAWKFDTEPQARAVARYSRGAEVCTLAEAQADAAEAGRNGRPAVVDLKPAGREPVGALTLREREDLAACEKLVDVGLKASAIARAKLEEIRARRLYREHFATFEDYARERWGFSVRHLHRIADQAQIEAVVGQAVTESHARELKLLPDPGQQIEAWQEAQQTAAGGRVTAQHVRQAVQKQLPAPPAPPPKPAPPPPQPVNGAKHPAARTGEASTWPEPNAKGVARAREPARRGSDPRPGSRQCGRTSQSESACGRAIESNDGKSH